MYAFLNYGDFIDGSPSNTADPYIQFLSTTDAAKAHTEFVAQRLNGKDTTGHQSKPNNSSVGSKTKSFFQKYKVPILGAAAVVGAAAIAGIVWSVVRRRKPAYRPLYEPAPVGLAMPTVSGYGYNAGAQYADPWTQRRT